MKRPTTARVALGTGLGLTLLSGCGFTGPNSVQLPFTAGAGDDAIVITVEMDSAANLVPNSEVKVGNVTMGSVRKIEFRDWHAELTVGLEPGTALPANATARIGQKSLLGAEYLELLPPESAPADVELEDGAVIPLERTGRFPETEEVLAALSGVLNGGGLGQLRTITDELNAAFNGKQADWHHLIGELDGFVSGVNAQSADLVRLLQNMNRLGGTLAEQRKTLEAALDTLPRGLEVLEQERPELIHALDAVGDFGVALSQLVDASQDDLVATLRGLRPVLREIADAGKDLPQAVGMATFPLPIENMRRVVRGDYANLYLSVDLSVDRVMSTLLAGTPIEGLLTGLTGVVPGAPGKQKQNPLLAPLGLPELSELLAGGSLSDTLSSLLPGLGSLLGTGTGGLLQAPEGEH